MEYKKSQADSAIENLRNHLYDKEDPDCILMLDTGPTTMRMRFDFEDGSAVIMIKENDYNWTFAQGVHSKNFAFLKSVLPKGRHESIKFFLSSEVLNVLSNVKITLMGQNDWSKPAIPVRI